MKETLKDRFIAENDYVIEIVIDNETLLFVEGLDELGCAIMEDFDIDKIKNLCIELIVSGDMVDTIDTKNITINTKIKDIIKLANENYL